MLSNSTKEIYKEATTIVFYLVGVKERIFHALTVVLDIFEVTNLHNCRQAVPKTYFLFNFLRLLEYNEALLHSYYSQLDSKFNHIMT